MEVHGQCPHCEQPAAPADAAPGAVVDCVHCDRSFVVPALYGAQHELAPSPPERVVQLPSALPEANVAKPARKRRGEAGLTATGLLAIGLLVVFYAGVVWPLRETGFGQLFGNRGWVPYAISYLSCWSLALLAGKYRRISRQSGVLRLDLVPRSIGERITPENAPAFLAYLRGLPGDLTDNSLVQRIERAVAHFAVRARVSETVDQIRSQAESDEAQLESSYSMVRVFIWAIPILGFIGTVMGIGASVGGFSESVSSASDLEVMKDSIGTVTEGLGVAFDTTLLALVMSIFIMFPTSSLQRLEEEFLASIEDYCRQHLIGRLDDGGSDAEDTRLQHAVDRLADALVTRLAQRDGGGSKVH